MEAEKKIVSYSQIILFLDIDGVLYTFDGEVYWRNKRAKEYGIDVTSPEYYDKCERMPEKSFDPVAMACLEDLCHQLPNMKIVISSTWRKGLDRDVAYFNKILGPVIGPRVIGKTPILEWGVLRGIEIAVWLKRYRASGGKWDSCIILDDDADMYPMQKYFWKTDPFSGFGAMCLHNILDYFKADYTKRKLIESRKILWWWKNYAFYFLVRKPLRSKLGIHSHWWKLQNFVTNKLGYSNPEELVCDRSDTRHLE